MNQNYYASIIARKGRPFAQVQQAPLMTREEALIEIHEEMSPKDPF